MNKHTTTFVKDLGCVGGVITWDEISNKQSKRLVTTCMLMDARIKEERNVIFGKLLIFVSSAIIFVICNALIFWKFLYLDLMENEGIIL